MVRNPTLPARSHRLLIQSRTVNTESGPRRGRSLSAARIAVAGGGVGLAMLLGAVVASADSTLVVPGFNAPAATVNVSPITVTDRRTIQVNVPGPPGESPIKLPPIAISAGPVTTSYNNGGVTSTSYNVGAGGRVVSSSSNSSGPGSGAPFVVSPTSPPSFPTHPPSFPTFGGPTGLNPPPGIFNSPSPFNNPAANNPAAHPGGFGLFF